MDWIVLLAASAVFGGVWWGMSKLGAHTFFIAALSLLAALIVWQSRSLLGIPL
jgi:hypothetical protein